MPTEHATEDVPRAERRSAEPRLLIVPLLVGLAWMVVGATLLVVRPHSLEVDLLHLYPWMGPRWMSAVPSGCLLLVGAFGLVSFRREGWWAGITIALAGAVLHPYQLVLSVPFVPYLLMREVRAAYGVSSPARRSEFWVGALATLVVVAALSLSALHVLLLPYVTGALDLGKQKRTMGDMRTIATAVENYSIDYRQYPHHVGNVEGLRPSLEPT